MILVTASLSSNTQTKILGAKTGNTVNVVQNIEHSSRLLALLDTCVTANNGLESGNPSNLNPTSKEMISDSVGLCETEVCFLYVQLVGTNV